MQTCQEIFVKLWKCDCENMKIGFQAKNLHAKTLCSKIPPTVQNKQVRKSLILYLNLCSKNAIIHTYVLTGFKFRLFFYPVSEQFVYRN